MSASGPPVRVGLVGFGLAGSVFHAPLVATTPGLHLAAVVTRDPARAAQARAAYPDVEVVNAAERLWDGPVPVDLVVIATPNRTHQPLALAALRAGRHVVVDKPLAPTAADASRVLDEAARRGLVLTVFQNRRWDGDFLTVRRLVADGALGDVVRFESRYDRWRPTPKPGWRQDGAAEAAGGLLYDLGSHLVDQALQLFGPADAVYAELDRRHPTAEVDDDAFVALTHRSGVRSHLWMSTLAAQPGARFRVLGSRGAYVKHGLDVQEAALRAGAVPDARGWGEEPPEGWGTVGAGADAVAVRTEPGAYGRFYAGVAAAVIDGAPPPVDPADAVATLAVIEAGRQSAAESRVVRLDAVHAAPASSRR